jgi:RNA 2',3'-cyclic 3'-phosphodiesterase
MRIFIAYVIDDHTKNELSAIQQRLCAIYQDGRHKQPKNMHMTLKFVGDVTVEQFDRLIVEIDSVISHYAPLTIELDHLGIFGKSAKKHSLWIGCKTQSSMVALSSELTRCVSEAGIPNNETPFVPHITLAQHGTLIESLPEINALTVCLNQVCVFLSSRIDNELVYQPLKCWELK